ncbi:MAG: phytanoyl-CoA dioxygenase family protein [Planctomycetaceae bacterium]
MEHQIIDKTIVQTAEPRTSLDIQMLSPDQREQFQRDGFLILRGLAGGETIQRMREVAIRDLEAAAGPVEYEADTGYPGAPESFALPGGRTIRRLLAAHARDVVFTEWVSQAKVINILRQLLGPSPVMPLTHHNCVMTKQPQFSSDTGWHQDIRYWSFERPELVSLWLALGSECEQNGCLTVIPGSHHWELGPDRLDDQQFFREDLQDNRNQLQKRIPVVLEQGDALIFHCRMLHAASRNRADATKFSVVFTFRPADNPPIPGSRSASQPEMMLPPDV